MTTIDFYFDVVSPYAYLAASRLAELPKTAAVRCRPVLFAALLDAWGHKGPAEIPAKRVFIYRQCLWLARRLGVPFRMPPHHPFNPLKALRLVVALDATRQAVEDVFRCIWRDGLLPDDPAGWAAMARVVGIADPTAADARVNDPAVKAALRANTEEAVKRGVFGVPTFAIGNELFWGADSLDMLRDYLADPRLFDDPEMRRIETLTPSAERPGGRAGAAVR
jgi:2-hydroxychromene-2-carboxylate isomerase